MIKEPKIVIVYEIISTYGISTEKLVTEISQIGADKKLTRALMCLP